ncbi:hypothetical protein AMTRI_Chr05g60870 [Amborella trichopoda]
MAHEQWLLLAFVGLGMGLQAMAMDFDFYYYVSQWPGSYCAQSKKGCCLPTTRGPDEDFFTVGLYATTTAGTLVYMETSLSRKWPSIKCPSNNGISMSKSLSKNSGVCSNLLLVEYFEKGLVLHYQLNPRKALKKHSLQASCRLYQLTDIKQALKEEIGEEVGIRCSTNLEGEFQLYEVYVCIDKSFATGVIPCPTLPYFTCSDEILFPAFNVQMLKKNGTRNSLELQVE